MGDIPAILFGILSSLVSSEWAIIYFREVLNWPPSLCTTVVSITTVVWNSIIFYLWRFPWFKRLVRGVAFFGLYFVFTATWCHGSPKIFKIYLEYCNAWRNFILPERLRALATLVACPARMVISMLGKQKYLGWPIRRLSSWYAARKKSLPGNKNSWERMVIRIGRTFAVIICGFIPSTVFPPIGPIRAAALYDIIGRRDVKMLAVFFASCIARFYAFAYSYDEYFRGWLIKLFRF